MPVSIEVKDFIATVLLDRPEAMNALDPESVSELHAAWDRISNDDSIRVAILTGAGERAFCTGADLKKTMPPRESFAELHFGAAKSRAGLANLQPGKPVIAAIHRETVKAVASSDYQTRVIGAAQVPISSASPEEFQAYMARQAEAWAKVIKPLNLTLD